MAGILSSFWHSPGRNVRFVPLALVLLLLGCFIIFNTSESSPLRGWIVDLMVTGEQTIHSKVATPSLTAPLRKWLGNRALFPTFSPLGNSWNRCLHLPQAFILIRQSAATRGCAVRKWCNDTLRRVFDAGGVNGKSSSELAFQYL